MKPDAFDGLPEPAPITGSTAGGTPEPDLSPLEVHADTDRVVVPKPGQPPATLRLKLTIDEGFHINANQPGIEGGQGVRATVSYPNAAKYEGDALPDGEGPLMVHAGEIEITIELIQTGDPWQGRPMLVLSYQACDDRACFKPETTSLDVALDPG